jgi:hypothetical protein
MINRRKTESVGFPLEPGSAWPGFDAHTVIPDGLDGELLAQKAGLDGSNWRMILYPVAAVDSLAAPLGDLALGTPDSNPFYDPLCLAAGVHRALPSDTRLLVVWETIGGEDRARFMLPVTQNGSGYLDHPYLDAVSAPLIPLTDPLLLGEDTGGFLSGFADLCRQAFANGLPPLRFPSLDAGSCLTLLTGQAGLNGLAVVARPAGKAQAVERPDLPALGNASSVRLDANRRELDGMGGTDYERAGSPLDVLLRFEEFLLLESSDRTTGGPLPLHRLKKMAAFARQTVYGMAQQGRCEIFTLRVSGRAVASLVMLRSGGTWFAWKLAVSARYRMFRPDLVLIDAVTREIATEPGFEKISCPGLDVPGLSEIWPGSIGRVRLALAATPEVANSLARPGNGPGILERMRDYLTRN